MPKQRVLDVLEKFFSQRDGHVQPEQLGKLMLALHPGWSFEHISTIITGLPRESGGKISYRNFVDWLYDGHQGGPKKAAAVTGHGDGKEPAPAADPVASAGASQVPPLAVAPEAGASGGKALMPAAADVASLPESATAAAADAPTPSEPSRPLDLVVSAGGGQAPPLSVAPEAGASGGKALAPVAADVPTLLERATAAAADAPTPSEPSRPRGSEDSPVEAIFALQLKQLIEEHPYIEPGCSLHPHPLQYWIQLCRDCVASRKFAQAQDHLRRARNSLETDKSQIAEAFRRFDVDKSGHLDAEECRNMCAYLGWSMGEGALMILDRNGKVTLPDFQLFIGRMGGVQHFFEHRRLRISMSRRDVCDHSGITVGARVRAHFYVRGQKSRSWREAVVTAVGVERRSDTAGPATYGVQLEFGFGGDRRWRARQVVPPSWVLSGVEDASVAAAMREVGILSEHKAFWELLLPDSEMQAVERLEPCQRAALTSVRTQAAQNHNEALPKVRERFQKLGYGETELQAVLGWVQDLAPVVIHVFLDRMGQFMEVDEFYRSQFETKTSCGALDSENKTRSGWEHNLFGGCYDGCKAFDRCKYGALNVMNDYRGVVRARGYGDSYLVLKDVRLRCSFSSTDSGGLAGSQLAVLDHYAHVLAEYNDEEIRGLVAVAAANTSGESGGVGGHGGSGLELLRGPTEDPGMDWITLGFPSLAQHSGRYFFEVLLYKDCSTPQVGFLSTSFLARPRATSAQGVGDDEHGWAADGQNAALWHGGCTRAWGTLWPHETRPVVSNTKLMTQDVVVGIVIDLDAREMWFATDGTWDLEPAFDAEDIPPGLSLYPAISLKGRAAFNFGPNFTHKPMETSVWNFARWPGAAQGMVRVDNPRLGSEEKLSIYKEVQIHGEVSLKRNVQRLVACNKYREAPKVNKAWMLRVLNAGAACAGMYKRSGARGGMPLYKSGTGGVIYCDRTTGFWRMNGKEEFDSWAFCAPAAGGRSEEPPRNGWRAPDADCGVLPAGPLRRALQAAGVDGARRGSFLAALGGRDAEGRELAQRVRGSATLQSEWARLVGTTCTAEEAWAAGIAEMQKDLLQESAYKRGVVIESSHPYEAKRHEWRREVRFDGAEGLTVNFCSSSCTLDGRTRLRIFTGGLSREAAGAGARVEVPLPGGDKVWGTVLERGADGTFWHVRLDRHKLGSKPAVKEKWPVLGDLVEGQYKTGAWHKATVAEVQKDGTFLLDWYDGLTKDREKPKEQLRRPSQQAPDHRNLEDVPRYAPVPDEGLTCFAHCMEEPAKVAALYSGPKPAGEKDSRVATVGDEISRFGLQRDRPLQPFRVESFKGKGPAQEAGVREGWCLDLAATVSGPSGEKLLSLLDGVGGISAKDREDTGALLDAAFGHAAETLRRLNEQLLTSSDVVLTFTNSCSPSKVALLPEAHVSYGADKAVGSEIRGLSAVKKKVHIKGFAGPGPAQVAGVRTDWLLDLDMTLNHNPGVAPMLDEQLILSDPNVLLTVSGVTLVFKQPHATPVQRFEASGSAGTASWQLCTLPGDFAEFVFSTDGDGGSQPDRRWGVWALVHPIGAHDPWAKTKERARAEAEEEIARQRAARAEEAARAAAEEEEARRRRRAQEALIREEEIRQGGAGLRSEERPAAAAGDLEEALRQGDLAAEAERRVEAEVDAARRTEEAKEEARREEAEARQREEAEHVETERASEEAESRSAAVDRAIREEVDAFAARWAEATQRARGCAEQPDVQRGGWDEARLRALCARHGWEFEWMTEDGERRRRAREVWDPSAARMHEGMVRPFEADTMIPDGSAPVEAS